MTGGLALAGVLTGLLAFLFLGMQTGMAGTTSFLAQYPLTRTFGLTIPVVQLVLLGVPRVRARFAAALVGGPLVYAGAGIFLAGVVALPGRQGSFHFSVFGAVFAFIGLACASPFGMAAVRAWRERARTRRELFIAAFSIVLMLMLPATDWITKERGFPGRLDRAAGASEIDLREIHPGDWQRLLVFGWYADGQEIDRALGHEWEDKRRNSVAASETHHLFLFVDSNNRVLAAYEIPRGVMDFCPKLHFLELRRDQGVVAVEDSSRGRRCLRQPSAVSAARHDSAEESILDRLR